MRQLRLNLGSQSDGGLRGAFARCPGLARQMTFEQAVKCEAVRRCLVVVAQINEGPRATLRGGTHNRGVES